MGTETGAVQLGAHAQGSLAKRPAAYGVAQRALPWGPSAHRAAIRDAAACVAAPLAVRPAGVRKASQATAQQAR
eukprot:442144-Prymnesium_polylepis.1